MAIAKWNPFGAQSSTNSPSTEQKQVPVAVSTADAKQFGLENFGNTCYANSVLQALYFCAPFRELVLQSEDHSIPLDHIPLQPAAVPTPIVPPPVPATPIRRKPERKHSTTTPVPDPLPIPPPPGLAMPADPPTLFSALRSLFVHISTHPIDKGVVAPKAFIEKLKQVNDIFRSTMHQDAHEFLNYLLNKIVEEIEEERRLRAEHAPPTEDPVSASLPTLASKAPPTVVTATTSSNSGASPEDATLVHRLFEGVLTSETRCLTCETVSSRDESFLDLSIDIEQNSSVTACLRAFSASEMLCQKNKFFCDSCCDLQEAEKRMKIKKLPNVLALHLKRFKIQEDSQRYIKLAYRVAFPFELRLFNTVDEIDEPDRLYELFGVVVHIGQGPSHGHYISLIKTMGIWVVFDDGNVYPITESDIPKYFGESNAGSAYVLYYQAVDIDLAELGLRPPTPAVVPEPVAQAAFDPSLSSLETAPALPPGLEDGDSSDRSDPPFPITPLPSSPILYPPSSESPAAPLTVNISHYPEDLPVPPSAVTPTHANGKSGIFRRTSSYPKSLPDKRASSDEHIPPIPPPPPVNISKERREPERKPSIWFKRRSFKIGDGKRSSEHQQEEIPATPGTTTTNEDESPNSSWFKPGTRSKEKKKPRRPSEANPFESPVPSFAVVPASAAGLSLMPDTRDRGYESPSPGSATSSFGSSSVVLPLPAVIDDTPASPLRQKSRSSLEQNENKPGSFSHAHSASTPKPLPIPPYIVPPTPPHDSESHHPSNGHFMNVVEGVVLDIPQGKSQSRSSYGDSEWDDTQHTRPALSTSPSSFALSNGNHSTSSSTTSTSSAGMSFKRATRKLSLSGPLLGFGRKQKDKSTVTTPRS